MGADNRARTAHDGETLGGGSWYTCMETRIGISNIIGSAATMTADIQTPVPMPPLDLLLLDN